MFILCLVQSTPYSSSRELVFTGIASIIDRYFIAVIKTGAGSVTFFLFQILNSISRAKSFEFPSQLPERYLNKILIIRGSNINFLLNTWVVSNYQIAYLMFKTVVNYYSRSFVQIVPNAVITPLVKPSLFVSQVFDSLLILKRLKISILLVVPLINAFESFSINQKLMPISIDTSTQIINSHIQGNSLTRIDRCFYLLIFIYVLNLKLSRRVFWMYSYLLNFLVLKSFWKLDFNCSIFLFKLARHGNVEYGAFESNPGNNQWEITFFGQIFRHLCLLVTTSDANSLEQSQERPHTSIYYLHCLLSNISIKQLIILIRLADMVVRFIAKTFSFLKEILSAFVQCHIEKIFAQACQCSKSIKLLLAKSSKLVLLRGVHSY